ncbi:MAG: structural protein P5 [Alistipes sp.]
MSRGLTNCNPGNIRRSKVRYKGEVQPSRDRAFKQFESLAWGYRAIFMLLHTYHVRYGLHTVERMIARWAPPTENHTQQYIRYVADAVGVAPNEPLETLDAATMIPIAAAISEVENGTHANLEQVREGWRLFTLP